MVVRPLGRLVRAREVQREKAFMLMEMTPLGRLVRAREVQPSKA